MTSSDITVTPDNMYTGELPEGCQRCLKGEKSVVYATGSCGVGCYYCTLPTDRMRTNIMAINELDLDTEDYMNGLLEEVRSCDSTGVGITGGDPIIAFDRTVNIIKLFKSEFGSDFHIHLYNSGEYLTLNKLDILVEAGLDEIRFHPKEISKKSTWELASQSKQRYPEMIVGFEIPAIPGKKSDILDLINFANSHNIDFINFNEFEFTEANFIALDDRDFIPFKTSSGVIGSKEMMVSVLEESKELRIPLHFCSSSSKDSIQLQQRYLRRAQKYARPYDSISNEGEIEYGQFIVENANELKYLKSILENLEIMEPSMRIFEAENRIECGWVVIDELAEDLREFIPTLKAEIISRYPIENGPITWIDPK